MIRDCLSGVKDADGCIAAVPVNDTLKTVDPQARITGTIDRAFAWLAQTPQAFRCDTLLKAHQKAIEQGWEVTDDAALLERLGGDVRVIPGSPGNIKITTPDDLALAAAIAGLADDGVAS
jgi:2-C-methyl-D-erythritol 4-phosphate cytidylyltransferase